MYGKDCANRIQYKISPLIFIVEVQPILSKSSIFHVFGNTSSLDAYLSYKNMPLYSTRTIGIYMVLVSVDKNVMRLVRTR